ncbi:MAG: alpha/beta hydrolase [Xanthomonadaceae bacterium]|nr:alpha/beta hydrolase [Xanthomonadaceae bacterium]
MMFDLKSTIRPFFYSGTQSALQAPLKALGFKFERRRKGDLGVSLWRLKTRKKKDTLVGTKRFVFIPGFGDSPVFWLGVMTLLLPRLRAQYDEIVFFDFPGFSGLYYGEAAFSDIDSYFSHGMEVLDQLQAHSLMGHSLGGWLATHYCVSFDRGQRPARAKKPEIVIIGSPPNAMTDEHCEEQWKETFNLALEGQFEKFVGHMFAKVPWIVKSNSKQLKWFFSKPEIQSFMKSIRRDHLVKEELKHLPAQTYLLWGDQDQINFYRWSKEWLKHAPRSLKLVTFPGVGHMLHMETPFRVAYMLGKILAPAGKVSTIEFVRRTIVRVTSALV